MYRVSQQVLHKNVLKSLNMKNIVKLCSVQILHQYDEFFVWSNLQGLFLDTL